MSGFNDFRDISGTRFNVLFRIIRCLDCEYSKNPAKVCSLMHSQSILNQQIYRTIIFLTQKKLSQIQIVQELKLVYGNHVIANTRDLALKTVQDE